MNTDPELDSMLSDLMQRDELTRLIVEAAVAAERERCAKIAETDSSAYACECGEHIAAAIRARGES